MTAVIHRLCLALTLVFLLAIGAVGGTSGGEVQAHEELDTSPFDMSIAFDRSTGSGAWIVTVTNERGNLSRPIDLVKVQLTYTLHIADDVQEVATETWKITGLARGSAERRFVVPNFDVSLLRGRPVGALRMHAEIVETDPPESPGFQYNNAVDDWRMSGGIHGEHYTDGDAGVRIAGIGNRFPQAGGTTTVTVRSRNTPTGREGLTDAFSQDSQYDVQVAISLSPGLVFAETQQQAQFLNPGGIKPAPLAATTFNPVPGSDTAIWDVGTLRWHSAIGVSDAWTLPVAVQLTDDSLADLPLEERCLTATVVRVNPWFEFVPVKRQNDVVTACLGDGPLMLARGGEIALFDLFPCVGITSDPCTGTDTLELVATLASPTRSVEPDRVVVQVQDPNGRHDGNWRTGTTSHHGDTVPQVDGIGIAFDFLPTDYSAYSFALSDVSPKQRPGRLTILGGSTGTFTVLDTDTQTSAGPFNLPTSITAQPYPVFLVFGTLGTYRVQLTVGATKSGTPYSDSTTYTFHVGPISELEVRDGEAASPLPPAGSAAYTVVAANNGPDTASSVVVTLAGVPRDAEAIASEGGYAEGACGQDGLCAGTWTLGALQTSERRVAEGELASPTLTLIPPAGANGPATISASIANMQPYTVVIDGTVHSTDYYDYIDENNTAAIEARPGTGAGAPGQPQDLSARVYPDLRSVLLRWDEVERLHEYAVTHYEVHRSEPAPGCQRPPVSPPAAEIAELRGELYLDESLRSGQERCYAVRAVNGLGGQGYWSHSAGTQRGLILSASALTIAEAAGHADYTVVLSSQPSDDVTVSLAASNRDAPGEPNAVLLSPHVLRFTPQDWNTPRTVRVIGVDDSADNPSNRRTAIITHTASGGGYGVAPASTLVVTVTDDDGPQGVTLSAERVTVAEDGGEGRYTLALTGAPSGPVQIDLSVSAIDGTPAATVAPARLTFLPEDWSEPQAVTVTGLNDDADNAGDQRVVTISHAISGGGYGDVDVPDVTVTVVDDDGPPPLAGDPGVTISETSIIVPEDGAGSYSVVLNSAPTGEVRINLSSANAALATVSPAHLVFTTGDWDEPQLVVVSGVDDDLVNPGERRSTRIHHAVSGGGYDSVVADPVNVAVTDDETAGITVSVAAVSLRETGDGGTGEAHDYTVRLATEPMGEVTVTVSSAEPNVATVEPQRLRFTPEDWFIPHVVTVTAVNDGAANPDGERRAAITHAIEGGGYEAAPRTVAVTVEDDDSAGVVISNPAVRVSGAPTGIGRDGVLRVFHRWTYTVTLTSKPTSEVTVQIDPGDKIDRVSVTLGHRIGSAGDIGNLTQGLTHEVVLQPDKWDDGATIQVTVIAPADHEGMATLKHKTISEDPSYSDREWETLPVAWGS